mgnify:FL=1
MQDASTHIAVIDIGRTNKKLLLYDLKLNPVDGAYATIDDIPHGNENHEPIDATAAWFLNALADMAASHRIANITITTYGGAFVCLDEQGRVALPPLSGSTDPGEDVQASFDALIGDPRRIQRRMATPRMPFLSVMARGIHYVKERYPELFARTRTLINLPQYYGYLLTGQTGNERTYMGTHTALWDFERMDWSEVRERLGVEALIPPTLSRAWDVLGTLTPEVARKTGLSPEVRVTMGIHDSNAAMVPFLIKQPEDFMLVSTGSMCVVMHPEPGVRFREEDFGEMVYYNLNAFDGVFKTALFVAGLEFDIYMGLLGGRHGRQDPPDIDPELLADILGRREEFILPAIVPFGMYLNSPARLVEGDQVYPLGDVFSGKGPRFLDDYERSCALLTLSMALHTRKAMERAGHAPGMPVIIEGGFSHNALYTRLIASLAPESPVMLTGLKEASAFGAALLGLAAHEGVSPHRLAERFTLTTTRVPPFELPNLRAYVETFERRTQG